MNRVTGIYRILSAENLIKKGDRAEGRVKIEALLKYLDFVKYF